MIKKNGTFIRWLQEVALRQLGEKPEYSPPVRLDEVEGEDRRMVRMPLNGRNYKGVAGNKKRAKVEAAASALRFLKELPRYSPPIH